MGGQRRLGGNDLQIYPSPEAGITVVDSSIELFSMIFPMQNAQTQETVIEQLVMSSTFPSGRLTPLRKAACRMNSLVAILGSLKNISAKKGKISSPKIASIIRDFVLVIGVNEGINQES